MQNLRYEKMYKKKLQRRRHKKTKQTQPLLGQKHWQALDYTILAASQTLNAKGVLNKTTKLFKANTATTKLQLIRSFPLPMLPHQHFTLIVYTMR